MLMTPRIALLIAAGAVMQFTPANLLQVLDKQFELCPKWLIGLLVGASLIAINAFGGDSAAPFIYFKF